MNYENNAKSKIIRELPQFVAGGEQKETEVAALFVVQSLNTFAMTGISRHHFAASSEPREDAVFL